MAHCCEKCFQDGFIRNKIIQYRSRGDCDFCGSRNQYMIPVDHLTEDFDRFLTVYDKAEEGPHWDWYVPSGAIPGEDFAEKIVMFDLKPLHQYIQDDWSIFSNTLTEAERIQLLSAIYSFSKEAVVWSGGQDPATTESAKFYDNIVTDDDKSSIWEQFCHEIKNENRFIIQSTPINEVEDLLDSKRVLRNVGEQFFRARIGHDMDEKRLPIPYASKKMGMAPAELATDGRANPRGIAYLYTASDIKTAISEVRPWKSALVSVATFKLEKKVEIVDLTMSQIESPFQVEDLRRTIQLQQLLEAISMEFSKPVGPSYSGIDYLPTQFIAELIKSKGYGGFKFKSSIAGGDNYLFFSDRKLSIEKTSLHKVNEIRIEQSLV